MLVDGTPYRTVWLSEDASRVEIIDQRALPFAFVTESLRGVEDTARAIREMLVRGAGCIGAVAGYGMYLAARECAAEACEAEAFDRLFAEKGAYLEATRPTAVNLAWAVRRQRDAVALAGDSESKVEVARRLAETIADEDAEWCRRIGEHGLPLLQAIHAAKGGSEPVNVLTHCNAGWLAFVDHGSATAPIYAAHDAGIPVHVWVDETRPRNQGARLTAWELAGHGVPHTVVVDNAGGHLMQRGLVDIVITGTDRTTFTGDVANKIGTYLKALAAKDNGIPFWVALPSSSIDWETRDGVADIPIEERSDAEVRRVSGLADGEAEGAVETGVALFEARSPAANPAFDVTPARLVTGLITERGRCPAEEGAIRELFPDKRDLLQSSSERGKARR